jgi:3-hydroxyacyl-CoA dehydrogenase
MLTTLPRPKFAAKQPIPPDTVIGVIGAGTMGAGIAEVAACGGHPVKIFDSIPEAVTRALGPFQWSRQIGLRRVHNVLQNLLAYYGEDRYRTSPLIKNNLWIGKQLDEP